MAEQTRGGGFRERIHFEAELWHEIENVSGYLRLKPTDLVKMLTALGLAQMKALAQVPGNSVQDNVRPVIQASMEKDFERMTGVSASSPVMGSE
jgi:hypothetical protein